MLGCRIVRTASLLAFLAVSTPLGADQSDPRLDPLFERLQAGTDRFEAQVIEAQIWALWMRSENEASQKLLEDGTIAMRNRDYDEAIGLFDELIGIDPDFAEAWNKRATVHWLRGDHVASMHDIRETLRLEPRHFGAISGLGMILMEAGSAEQAIRAFETGLEIHPFLTGARQHIEILKDRLRGNPL